jgi:hypothetical protein
MTGGLLRAGCQADASRGLETKKGQVDVTSFDYRKAVWPVENMRDNVSAAAGLMDDSRQIHRSATGSWRLQLHTTAQPQ